MRNITQGTLSLYTPAGARKYVTEHERTLFLIAAAAYDRPEIASLCAVLAWTGCRISEALALTAGSIDRMQGFIAIRCLKKRSAMPVIREVPVPDDLLDTLQRVHDLGSTGPQSRLWRLSRSRAWQLIKLIMREAGITPGPHATPKGLRHGFGMHAIRSSVPITLVQRWLGHASINTTAIYLQAMGREEREIAARMWTNGNRNRVVTEPRLRVRHRD